MCPTRPPYYDESFFEYIREVKQEGLLNLKTMSSGMWYRVLLENHVTHQLADTTRSLLPCKAEIKNPEVDWEIVWNLAVTPGLPSQLLTFIWLMIHDLLPSQVRLFRLRMPNVHSNICTLCTLNSVGDLVHSLLLCPYNDGAGQFLHEKLHFSIPNLLPQQVVLLDLDVDDDQQLPLVYLTASVFVPSLELQKRKNKM